MMVLFSTIYNVADEIVIVVAVENRSERERIEEMND
jgi:hypothetical protein